MTILQALWGLAFVFAIIWSKYQVIQLPTMTESLGTHSEVRLEWVFSNQVEPWLNNGGQTWKLREVSFEKGSLLLSSGRQKHCMTLTPAGWPLWVTAFNIPKECQIIMEYLFSGLVMGLRYLQVKISPCWVDLYQMVPFPGWIKATVFASNRFWYRIQIHFDVIWSCEGQTLPGYATCSSMFRL